ncbi:hypothetical protein [Rhodococcus sp. W8901]|uniref:hypothetical protein n=1 Tax=Rhodococcus sp. W8901 TaxID=2742603 RepID=UPI0020C63AF1|nr:hypothetical protein [Rhodococcus sp. W8901]
MARIPGIAIPDVHEHGPPAAALPAVESVRKAVRHHWTLARIGMYLLLASLPLLAISAQVFGVAPMSATGALVIIPLAAVLVVLCVIAPHPIDRIVGHGLGWGMFACLVYDVFRLDTVYLLGLWDDFIPKMGTWLRSGNRHPDRRDRRLPVALLRRRRRTRNRLLPHRPRARPPPSVPPHRPPRVRHRRGGPRMGWAHCNGCPVAAR